MKNFLAVLCFCSLAIALQGQNQDSVLYGVVSYQNANSVYVKFNSTETIQVGDTLFINSADRLSPALVVKHISSISIVGDPLPDIEVQVSDAIVHKIHSASPEVLTEAVEPEEEYDVPVVPKPESTLEEKPVTAEAQFKEQIRGRLSASFYSNVFNSQIDDVQRMRYTFSLQANHVDNSRVSAEAYVSFRHQLDDWKAEKVEMSKALRVYNLAVRYDIGENTILALGRKVNRHISNIGAVDGLQAEHASGNFAYGGFVGTRPDYQDYGLNTGLMQFGGFISHRTETKQGYLQNSLALVEQRNSGMTDRRFAYFQHSSTLSKVFSVFTSFEIDLYERPDSVAKSTFNITGAYFSLQYRPSRKWTFFGSYDARKNVIYYETYRNFIDELIEQETRQGLRFRVNYRPIKYITLGSSLGYRFQNAQGSNSMNMYHYITHSRIPLIEASATASATILKNSYLHGVVYGLRLSRNVLKDKVYAQLEYRLVDYKYGNSEFNLNQNIAGINLSWRIRKKLALSIDYEAILEPLRSNHRVHFNVIQRF